MAYEIPVLTIGTMNALADLDTAQFKCVQIDDATGSVEIVSASGGRVLGVLQNKPKAGHSAAVMVQGVTKAYTGAAVDAGDPLTVDANARVIVATGANIVLGMALETAAASGTLIAVRLY